MLIIVVRREEPHQLWFSEKSPPFKMHHVWCLKERKKKNLVLKSGRELQQLKDETAKMCVKVDMSTTYLLFFFLLLRT